MKKWLTKMTKLLVPRSLGWDLNKKALNIKGLQ